MGVGATFIGAKVVHRGQSVGAARARLGSPLVIWAVQQRLRTMLGQHGQEYYAEVFTVSSGWTASVTHARCSSPG